LLCLILFLKSLVQPAKYNKEQIMRRWGELSWKFLAKAGKFRGEGLLHSGEANNSMTFPNLPSIVRIEAGNKIASNTTVYLANRSTAMPSKSPTAIARL
jgi:hypothetical protein